MVALMYFFLHLFTSPFRSKGRLEAENTILRHQLIVLEFKVTGHFRFNSGDRLFFTWLYRWFPSVLSAVRIIQPGALAPCRLSPLLALEISITGRPTTNRCTSPSADPTNERRQSAVG